MSSLDVDKNTSLEEKEIEYKAYLVNVTQKRKSYPSSLSKLLGCAVRKEINSIEAMKVDLPPRSHLEINQGLQDQVSSMEPTLNTLNEIVNSVQLQTSHLSSLTEAFDIVNNN